MLSMIVVIMLLVVINMCIREVVEEMNKGRVPPLQFFGACWCMYVLVSVLDIRIVLH